MKKEHGFVHTLLIIGLMVAIIGALGFIFWQNFIYKQPETAKVSTVDKSASTTETPQATSYKTFALNKPDISFRYPDTWSVNVNKNDTENGMYFTDVSVTDDTGEQVAEFTTGGQLGGTCSEGRTFNTLVAEKTNLKYAYDPIYFGVTALKNPDGGYDVHYGLETGYTEVETGKVCANTFYYNFSTPNNSWLGVGFGNGITKTTHFNSMDNVQAFISSDKFKQIKQMVLSLSY